MLAKELRQTSEMELIRHISELSDKLRHLRFEKSMQKLKNSNEIYEVKKDIARIKTILNEKKHGK
ncbi:MAG: 50S ribosomal protein L29 [Candidatus Portnoybacteria bacterium CG10_big_fil_rev_8_21_14_0_10_36_7]|uniref:Large ribosomal subunit protein uL29 n=1 Tax=Candidatus Portnoybacteria bacterium CG10_big_fil_rev_8_21_14_0_10_36_7 TaxID=1974812 RepID=A0A2M8KDF3_9BACT|nr:MAG: 50S ribosomal protein L29 [Candidatus Portnoybacteria bacterium CG10_big_fil_rev_8_21_14_0_10_36_7]